MSTVSNNTLVPVEVMSYANNILYVKETLDGVIDDITEQALTLVPDVSTDQGRKAIRSMRRKVASSKVFIDERGKELVAEQTAYVSAINAERKRCRDTLDALKDKVGEPLTQWEQERNARMEQARAALAGIDAMGTFEDGPHIPSESIAKRISELGLIDIEEIAKLDPDHEFYDNLHEYAGSKIAEMRQALEVQLDYAIKWEEDQRELKRLRAQAEEQRQRDHDEGIRKAAEEMAKKQAAIEYEAKAKQELLVLQIAEAQREAARIKSELAQSELKASVVVEEDNHRRSMDLVDLQSDDDHEFRQIALVDDPDEYVENVILLQIAEDFHRFAHLTEAQSRLAATCIHDGSIRHVGMMAFPD